MTSLYVGRIRSFIDRQTSGTSTGNKWQQMATSGTTSDNEWQRVKQRMTTSGTTSDNKWQWVTTITANNNEWQWVTESGKEEENSTVHFKEWMIAIFSMTETSTLLQEMGGWY